MLVKNLAPGLTEEELRQFFTTCGTVTDITISESREPRLATAMRAICLVFSFYITLPALNACKMLMELSPNSLDNLLKGERAQGCVPR